MPGGKYDSSRTRVAPVFDFLLARDKSGRSWLPKLLSLPEHGSTTSRPEKLSALVTARWGGDEYRLMPPLSLLAWLIRNLQMPAPGTEISQERRDLIARDPVRIEQALRSLRSDPSPRAWYVLEGDSYPDAVLATAEVLVVIEGKRTEAGPTTGTTWMPVRHQMLRHLDAAFELVGNRRLYGLFIVEGDNKGALPPYWVQACKETLSEPVLTQSLPHRPQAERQVIADAFIGATTWQRVCEALDVSYASLPNEVAV